MTLVGHGSLFFGFGGKVIHVDPFGKLPRYGTLPRADLVLITPAHGDRLDAAALAAVREPETRILVALACDGKVEAARLLRNGETTAVHGITVEVVPAHSLVHKRSDASPFHPRGKGTATSPPSGRRGSTSRATRRASRR